MPHLSRFGVSLEKELLGAFDRYLAAKAYSSRSEGIRDLIRNCITQEEWKSGGEVAGAITLIYDHHRRQLLDKITDIQHRYQGLIISASHIHLDHRNCFEIIAVKGRSQLIQQLADSLRSLKGVKHGSLSMASTGKHIV